MTQHCLFSGGGRGTVGVVSNVSIYKITLTALTLIYALSIFGNFRSVITDFFATFSPRLGVIIHRKGIFSKRSRQVHTIYTLPRITMSARALRRGTVMRCGSHRAVTILGNMRSGFRRLARVSDVLCKTNRFLLRSSVIGCKVVKIRLITALNAKLRFISPLRICLPGQGTGMGVTGPNTSFGHSCLCSPKIIFIIGRRRCSNGCVLASLSFVQRLLSCAARISTVRLGLGSNTGISSMRSGVRGVLKSSFIIRSHCRRRTSIFHVVRVRGLVSCLFLAFVLVVTYFGIVNSLSVLVLSGGSSIMALHDLKTGSGLVSQVFLFRKHLVSLFNTVSNVVLKLVLYFVRRGFNMVSLNKNNNAFVISTCPIDIRT